MAKCSTLVLLSFLVLETAILIHIYMNAVFPFTKDVMSISRETALLVNAYDTNGDGVIDLWEFEAVTKRIRESETHQGTEPESLASMNDNGNAMNFEDVGMTNSEILDIKAEFSPLHLDSMTKFRDEQPLQEDMQVLTGLKNWQKAAKNKAGFAVKTFQCFLPKRKNIALGEAWMLIAPNTSRSRYGTSLSSNRYTPPSVSLDHAVLQKLLQMFHPRPFLYSRFPPQGAAACIRAENQRFLEIQFRLHAEFQLNTLSQLPFWFTPAQFSGHITISKDGGHIEHFIMEVPNNQTLNVDMEWLSGRTERNQNSSENGEDVNNEQSNMEVDIGYLPQMKLESIAPSYYRGANFSPGPEEIRWEKKISRDEARHILERKMYPFKKVLYHSFDKAFERAKEEKKLVHSILLWGALDDQSC